VTTVLSPTTVIVEGISDRIAVETLAAKLGRDLDGEGISVVAIGGAQAIGNFLGRLGGQMRVAGLCDAGEEPGFRRALERGGLGTDLYRAAMEKLGFFVCVRDLEDELIRALGPDVVEEVVAEHGDLRPLRTLQKQAAWQGRPKQDQLRRFMGSGGRRKIRYARFLVDALDAAQVPRPLRGLLAYI